MKTLKYVPLLIILTVTTYSQNIIDPPLLPYNFNDTTIFDRNFNSNKFILGWNWGSPGRELDEALRINYYHEGYNPSSTTQEGYTGSLNYIPNHSKAVQITGVSGGRQQEVILNAHSLVLFPTITVDSTSNFVPRKYDSSGAVFGFLNKNKVRILDSTQHFNKDYQFALLDKDSITTGPEVVLSNIWKGDVLHFLNYEGAMESANDANLKEMYLAINIKSCEQIPPHLLSDTIITIKIPYQRTEVDTTDPNNIIYTYSNSYIKFNEISNPSVDSAADIMSSYFQTRGKMKRLSEVSTQEIAITGEMLKFSYFNPPDSCLTLYASFICDGFLTRNPYLEPDYYLTKKLYTDYISKLDVEVTYHGKINVGIKYIKFETERNQRLVYGLRDKEIKDRTDTLIALIDGNTNGVRLTRFYADDEMLPAQWAANRYYNMLMDTMASIESFVHEVNMPVHYLYATGFKEYWNGSNIRFYTHTAAPYIRKGIFQSGNVTSPTVLNYQFGYAGNDNSHILNDTLNSNYETFLAGFSNTIPISDPNPYEYTWPSPNTNYTFGLQFNVETFMYKGYYKNSAMLYNSKPWWANLWVNSESWIFSEAINSFSLGVDAQRPKTGEEVRLQTTLPVLLGTKGLIYWIKTTENQFTSNMLFLGLQPKIHNYAGLTGDSLLRSDAIGGDYVNVNDDPNGFHNYYNMGGYDWNTMGIDENRIYIGLASTRTEIGKINKWIEHNNDFLMSLKLQAWRGKGFLTWYSQAPGLPANIMKKYINTNYLYTQKIYNEFVEDTDSSFVDIMIHSIDGKPLDQEFCLGIQNRRTDPLIYFEEDVNDKHLVFLSTVEYERLCEEGGDDPTRPGLYYPASVWQSYRWKQLGSRIIRFGFGIIDLSKDIYYQVEEITDGTIYNDSLPMWKKDAISNQINGLYKQGHTFLAKFLPGEGKMYRVKIIYDTTSAINGELAFNNQTKLVAYPAHQTSNYDFLKDTTSGELNYFKDDSLYYHIVYHKKMPNNRYCVYYRRSMFPYTGDIATKIIKWGPELLVSDTIVFTKADHIPSLDVDTLACIAGVNISCRFPAIVVRYNEVAQKPYVYIVYSCDQPVLPDESRIFMVECAFPHDTTFFTYGVPSLRPIMTGYVNNIYDTLQYIKYGGVSINASFSGNYYTWCDSVNGIGVGWKSPNDRGYITNFKYIRHNLAAIGTQPALNTYSRFSIAEDNCALVFREQVGNDSQSKIIYTRLHNNPLGFIDNYLPPTFCEPLVPNHTKGEYSLNGKTAIINNIHPMPFYYNASYPTIYRLASFTLRPGYEYLDSMHYVGACWDRVCWTGTLSPDETSLKSIYMKNIDIADNNDCWFLLPEIKFWSPMYNLDHPHLSSGAASYKKDGTFAEYGQSDSANIIHYIAYPILDDLSYNADIYHRKFHTWTNYLARWDSGNPEDGQINFIEYMQPIGKGIYPHTSHTPVFTDKKDWHINSRVFQTINEQITTSSKLFLKGTTNKMAIRPLLMVSDSNANALISEINFTDSNAPLKLHAFSNTEHGFTALDTIYSDWFKIGSVKELSFLSLIKDSTIFSFTLEGGNGEIALSSGQESQLNRRNLTFLNGQNELYRLKLVKKNNSQTWFEILLDSEEEIYNKSVVISDIYDLSNSQSELYIYPNPAGDYINILINNNGVILSRDVQILNILGLVVSKSVLTDSNNRIDISNLPRGTYFIRIGDKLDKFVKL